MQEGHRPSRLQAPGGTHSQSEGRGYQSHMCKSSSNLLPLEYSGSSAGTRIRKAKAKMGGSSCCHNELYMRLVRMIPGIFNNNHDIMDLIGLF